MAMLNKLRLRLRALFFKPKMEDELQAELQFHLEREIEENIIRGMTPEEARYAALRIFGGVERVKEESRDVRGIRLLEELWQDLRYVARMLVKHRGFTVVAVLTLALGIGANTAVFSVVNAYIFKPLPVKEPEQLVVIGNRDQHVELAHNTSYLNYVDIRNQQDVFADVIAYLADAVNLNIDGQAERSTIELVSGNYFSMLGVEAAYGRAFAPDEAQTIGSSPVLVLSHGFWQRRF